MTESGGGLHITTKRTAKALVDLPQVICYILPSADLAEGRSGLYRCVGAVQGAFEQADLEYWPQRRLLSLENASGKDLNWLH